MIVACHHDLKCVDESEMQPMDLMSEAPPFGHAAWIAQCLARGELAPLGVDDIAELERQLDETTHAGGTFVLRAGAAPARVHIIRRGSIELSRELGGRRVVLQLLQAGDVFGDIPVVVRMLEPFDARAVEDSVLLSIDSVTLSGLLERRPRLARRWLVSVAQRMASIQTRLVEFLAGDVEAQVATLLLHHAENGTVRMSRSVLASLLGARRPSVHFDVGCDVAAAPERRVNIGASPCASSARSRIST